MADKKVTRTWDSYVKEAKKPPFELKVTDTDTIVIEAPTGGQLMDAEELMRSGAGTAEMLRVACGDAGDDVINLVRGAPVGAMNQLMADILDHFGFGGALQGEADSRT